MLTTSSFLSQLSFRKAALGATLCLSLSLVPGHAATDGSASTTGQLEREETEGDGGTITVPLDAVEPESDTGAGNAIQRQAPPDIQRDVSRLPEAVAKTRALLIEAVKSGDIEKLRPLLSSGSEPTMLSIGGLEGDPIEFLKEASGDEDGHEMLAILLEILEAPYVVSEEGSENELFLWPYFYAWPLDKLTPPMRVELFRIMTAGDLEDSQSFGSYVFYRVGIAPDGSLKFFVAGD